MLELMQYFESMPTFHKLGWILVCLVVSWVLEGAIPLVFTDYNKRAHVTKNLFFLVTSLLVNLVFGLLTLGIILWSADHQLGLLNMIDVPLWIKLIVGVMMLDFLAQWVAHYMLHRVKWMWKLHLVHHSDTMVDATTGTRHHPGDYLVREVFSLVTVLIFGIPLGVFVLYRILTIFFTYITHANIKIHQDLDKAMSYVFISPAMHKFHHHFERPWTDTNFGNIFSFWDRIFGTFVYEDTSKIRYGVDVLPDDKANDIAYQLKVPFNKEVKTDY